MKNLQKSLLLLVLLTFSGCQLEEKLDTSSSFFNAKFLNYFADGQMYEDTDGDKYQYFKSERTLGGYEYEGHYTASEFNSLLIGNFGTFNDDNSFTTNLIATVDTTTSNITIEKVPTEIAFSYEVVDYVYDITDNSLDATDISYEFFCVGGVHYGYDGTAFRFFEIGTSSVKVAKASTDIEIVGDNNYIINYNESGDITIDGSYDNIIICEGVTVSASITVIEGHTIGNIVNYGTVNGIFNYGTVTDIVNFGTIANIVNFSTVTGDIVNFGTVTGGIYNHSGGTVNGGIYRTTDDIYTYLEGSTERIDEVISYFEFVDIAFEYK